MATRKVLLLTLTLVFLCGPSSADYERLYTYKANASLLSPTSPGTISQWSLLGTLKLQSYAEKTIVQLLDLKSSAYNGEEKDIFESTTYSAVNNADSIYKPYVLNYVNGKLDSISVEPNDTLWSVNIKRAIASIFQVNFDKLENASVVEEKTLYGSCETKYQVNKVHNEIELKKELDTTKCQEHIDEIYETRKKTSNPHNQQDAISRTLEYSYRIKTDEQLITHIRTMSKIHQYYNKKDPKSFIGFHISYQNQTFDLIKSGAVTSPIDVSRVTTTKNVTFENDLGDLSQGRRQMTHRTQSEYISEWFDTADTILAELSEIPVNIEDHANYVDSFTTLREIAMHFTDERSLQEVLDKVNAIGNNYITNLWFSVLPVLGTEASFRHILNLCNMTDFSDFQAISLMQKFPFYIRAIDDEILKDLEIMMHLRDENFSFVRRIGILNFANVVWKCYSSGCCSAETYKHYVDKYLRLYNTNTDSEIKAFYLLGLYNLETEVKLLVPTIRNKTEIPKLRTRAIYAVKKQLRDKPDKAFGMFWPMVKDQSLDMDIRVAALDVILDSHMSVEHFKTIYDFLKDSDDRLHQHLYSYFYNSFENLREIAAFTDHLAKFVDYLPLDRPRTRITKQLGVYREEFFEKDNIYYETQVVEDPNRNQPTQFHLKMNRIEMGMDVAAFSVQFNSYQTNLLFFEDYISQSFRPNEDRKDMDEIINTIKKYNLKKRSLTYGLEVTVYSGDKAIFLVHVHDEVERQLGPYLQEFKTNVHLSHIAQYPVINHVHTATDIGTSISSEFKMNQFIYNDFISGNPSSKPFHHFSPKIRYITNYNVSLTSYNPLDDVNFQVTSIRKTDTLIDVSFRWEEKSVLPNFIYLTFKNQYGTDYVNVKTDNFVGMSVENSTYLKHHCPKCGSFVKVDTEVLKEDRDYTTYRTVERNSAFYSTNVTSQNCSQLLRTSILLDLKKVNFHCRPDVLGVIQVWKFLSGKFFAFSQPDDSCTYSFVVKPFLNMTEHTLEAEVDWKNGSMGLYLRNLTTEEVKNLWNVTYNISSEPESNVYHVDVNITESIQDTTKLHDTASVFTQVTIASEFHFPSPRVDPFEPTFSEPTMANITMTVESQKKDKSSQIERTLLNGTLSVSDEQRKLFSSELIGKCKEQSDGLKYSAPTDVCYFASNGMSVYQNYSFHIEFFGKYINYSIQENLATEFSRVNNSLFTDMLEDTFYFSNKFFEKLLVNPNMDIHRISYLDYSNDAFCIVTPDYVRTFNGTMINSNEIDDDKYLVGYLECVVNYGNAFAYSNGNKQSRGLSFKLWTIGESHNLFQAAPLVNSLNVTLNGEPVQSSFAAEDVSVTFMAEDFIHIKTKYQELYYNKEYILVKVNPSHIENFCGICGSNHAHVYL